LALVSSSVAQAADTVWSGLVVATNAPEPTPIPAELNRLEGTLKGLFGYNQFQVIGQSRSTIKNGNEDWLAASKYFSLRADTKSASRGGYVMNVQLFQEHKLLFETEAKLSKRSPIVARGPQVGEGQLVLVLLVE
jgi:opacity protein-like surface antigen